MFYLNGPTPEEELPTSTLKDARDAYKKHVDDALEFCCIMLATMNYEIQKQHM